MTRIDTVVGPLARQNPLSTQPSLAAQAQAALERQIAATDTQFDRLVYDLYGLTEDEIKIVEGAA
jgi:hypothetical protein